MSQPTRIINTLEDMLQAFKEATQSSEELILSNPEEGVAAVGVGYYKAMLDHAKSLYPEARIKFVLNCGVYPGWVMSALRQGITAIRFSGNSELKEKICSLARVYNAEIISPS